MEESQKEEKRVIEINTDLTTVVLVAIDIVLTIALIFVTLNK